MTDKETLEAAYLAGFNASGEGYNGEYGIDCPEENAIWKKYRDNELTAIKIYLEKKWSDLPCYEWPGYRTNLGYGQLGTAKKLGKNLYAHRLVWEAVNGPIHDGLVLDHLCRNPACVNPHHLEPVTNKENILRGTGVGASNRKKTHCKSGHEFDELNTGFLKDGRRYCKECQRASTKKSRIKHGTR